MARISKHAAILLVLFASVHAFGQERPPRPEPAKAQVRQGVERAIGYLQNESGTWLQRRCAACHHAAMPLWALSEAQRQGYSIDRRFLSGSVEAILGGPKQMIASKIAYDPSAPPDPRPLAKGVNMGAVFMAVAAESLPSLDSGESESLRQIANEAIGKQRADGSWDFFLSRPPINESQATDSAWILMALQGSLAHHMTGSKDAAFQKGMAWLSRDRPGDSDQVKVLKLLLEIRAATPREKLQPAINELLALQKGDGGWSQTTSAPSDAFATGQALYVLSQGGCAADQPRIRHATAFLLETQRPDGSWPMTSRATPDGRPGGAKLLTPITSAATAWATLGLVQVVPQK